VFDKKKGRNGGEGREKKKPRSWTGKRGKKDFENLTGRTGSRNSLKQGVRSVSQYERPKPKVLIWSLMEKKRGVGRQERKKRFLACPIPL